MSGLERWLNEPVGTAGGMPITRRAEMSIERINFVRENWSSIKDAIRFPDGVPEGQWITTYSGCHFDYTTPSVEHIHITDIAQALSHECRFAGHLDQFYSVAQHSVLVSQIVPPLFALEALLHDAAEAYCKDIPAPLKALLPEYKRIEYKIDAVIRQRFGVCSWLSDVVKHADLIMLATERRDLDIDTGVVWPQLDGITPSDINVFPLSPAQARHAFIARFDQLWGGE